MNTNNIIFALVFYILKINCLNYGSKVNATIPTITFIHVGENWRNFTTDKLSFYSRNGDDLLFSCKAPYPIQWKIDGLIDPTEVVKIQPPKRNLHEKTFEISINIFFLDAHSYPELATSTTIACVKIADSSILDEFAVFVRGSNPLPNPSITQVTDSSLIPCLTTDPSEQTFLFQRVSRGSVVRVTNVKYDPTKGFRFMSGSIFDGEYICKRGNRSVFITASRSSSGEFEFAPTQSTVKAFTEDSITLKCSSKEQPIKLIFKGNKENINTTWMENTEFVKSIVIRTEALPMNMSKSWNAACLTQSKGELIKEWTVEFIETPVLYLDNFEGEVDCLSNMKESNNRVQTVRCKNKLDCDFVSTCLANVTSCNFKKQKQFFAQTETFCWVEKLQTGIDCVSVPYSHLNGLAQCTVGGLKKTWEFFASLESLKYDNWENVPPRELLIMDEVPEVLYTNRSSQFFCTGTAYLFADSLSFEIEYINGSRYLLQDDGSLVNISNPSSENPRKIDEFNILGVLNIKLPLEAVAVHCLAPWWNSTDVFVTSRKFETRHLLSPTLTHKKGHVQEHFYKGENNRRLTCHAKGEPEPKYIWLHQGKNATEKFPELKISSEASGERHLEFPMVDEKYAGTYQCIARNEEGEVNVMYILEVTDEPISSGSIVYITVVVAVLIILALVCAAFFVMARRYKAARELVRNLTDSEIDDFFRGKPELLSNGAESSMQVIDFLPYKSDYEIMMDDIEFDSSEKNWLGSGEFSYVVRGKIISKCKWVAIKISKPSADVTLFKSLLSEVKIMIYIGDHENIVRLIGVCTEGIRNRCIHIATEICESGSLETYLRKGRPGFVDLMNANQAIDTSLMPKEGAQLSTLDLISFSYQIAKGMEYLAAKSIIHADLATRNVLLTAEKVAKISDFGLSKKLYECNNYVKKSRSPLPWRWMSIEALTTLTFSTQSDIWSYGATLYEIFTLGDIPFPNEEWNKEFLARLASGMRMGRPKYSTQEIYSKIVACWESEPDLRPPFTTLRLFFHELLKQFPPEILSTSNLPKSLLSPPSVTQMLYVNCDIPNTHPTSELPTPQYTNLE